MGEWIPLAAVPSRSNALPSFASPQNICCRDISLNVALETMKAAAEEGHLHNPHAVWPASPVCPPTCAWWLPDAWGAPFTRASAKLHSCYCCPLLDVFEGSGCCRCGSCRAATTTSGGTSRSTCEQYHTAGSDAACSLSLLWPVSATASAAEGSLFGSVGRLPWPAVIVSPCRQPGASPAASPAA